jgi:defect-in-organelle-trafficking protein DotC
MPRKVSTVASALVSVLVSALVSALVSSESYAANSGSTPVPEGSAALEGLIAAQPRTVAVISPVREAALRDTARVLGAQAGYGDRSRAIVRELKTMENEMDRRFRFGDLMLGRGILPASIDEVIDPMAIEGDSFRVAHRIYRISEPARPVGNAPTWRDWIYLGLDPDLKPQAPERAQLLPQDEAEKKYWEQELRLAYKEGWDAAQAAFGLNLARLERSYLGMRRFFELYMRGMVTWPMVATASSLVEKKDPNTIIVGSTVFRITAPTVFVDAPDEWSPLGQ